MFIIITNICYIISWNVPFVLFLLIINHLLLFWGCIISDVARICCKEGQRVKLCHGALTVDFSVGCSSCSMINSFVTNAVLIERAVSCWHQIKFKFIEQQRARGASYRLL